ncbi:hypothetical protein IA539_02105 [Gordonia sp. zg691]|uniref:SURF1 family cytochrome oxidase biogenesis protein n=1 Tax=Gordonia jinghuaiqii TaxID=2758710 RepID=UPI0016627925|nr:SURF1 family cytochrome oxidase biogenesis protein [Gordonia jinghuaiqii]MBD0860005.1 hypothetical protein [Gordonia jinghuaiqii]
MHVLRTILRPGWIALGVVVVAFAVACFTLLAPWQLGKNSDTERRNDLIRTATSLETEPLAEVAPASTFDPSSEWREIEVTGAYLTEQQALVRLRNVGQRPAVEVLTPFAVAGSDRVILVNRGFVRPEEGAVPDIPAPPGGEQTIRARIRAAESVSAERGARTENGALTVATINPGLVAAATSVPMDDFYLQLSPDQPGSLGEISLPQLDTGPYLSYGLQWLAFGVMAPLGVLYFLTTEIRARRRAAAAAREADAQPVAAGADTGGSEADAGTPRSAPVPPTGSRAHRRQHMRDELRAASRTTVTHQVGQIGHGPDADDESRDVRDKLSRRYGG